MYTIEQEKQFLSFAKDLLLSPDDSSEINKLRDILEYADWKYYVQDNPVLADVEYDTLFKKLQSVEAQFPELVTPSSPTQRVAKGLNKEFPAVSHLVPMLSLENSYNAEDLTDWDRKCRELSGIDQIEYCVEPKFDGASISLVYENDLLMRGATRGNGTEGDDITLNTKQIRSIPMKASISLFNLKQIEIRGEVVITKKRFEEYNQKLIADGQQPLANARNAASGSLRIKDPHEVAKRNLDAFLYNVSYTALQENTLPHPQLQTHKGMLESLAQLGFKTSLENIQTFTRIDDVVKYVQEFEINRDNLPYEIDGMVIKVNRLDLQEKIGQTSHHPRWAIAYKFKARQATSKLLNVEYQVGRTGSVTPVAKIEPVAVGGVTISSLSMFNEDVIKEKQLMIGDTVLIERAGDVIPYIVKSFPELREGNEQEIIFPTACPVCKEPLYKPAGEAVWRCTHINCEAQVIEKIAHFASKDAMDIRGLGDALVRRFFEQGLLKNMVGIYHLPYDQLKTLEGFGEKSMLNLKEAIEKSKSQPLHRLIFGLGIRYVGETTAKALARTVSHLTDLYAKTKEELLSIEDVGEKVATSIVEFFSHQDNRAILEALEKEGVCLANTQKNEAMSGSLVGKT
ncbi:MAG: NAD-dependent DNA ligase LigA, partial [Chitinophagaceae bacterium]|nr:NAD-dependent DNA ligase LigA [Chitinophagaceae bacterium]